VKTAKISPISCSEAHVFLDQPFHFGQASPDSRVEWLILAEIYFEVHRNKFGRGLWEHWFGESNVKMRNCDKSLGKCLFDLPGVVFYPILILLWLWFSFWFSFYLAFIFKTVNVFICACYCAYSVSLSAIFIMYLSFSFSCKVAQSSACDGSFLLWPMI